MPWVAHAGGQTIKGIAIVGNQSVSTAAIQAVLQSRVVVSGGAFIDLLVNEQYTVGAQVVDTDGSLELKVRLQAPSWVPVATLEIVANGEVVQTANVAPSTDVVRLEKTFTLNPTRDTWYVVLAKELTTDLAPVAGGARMLSFTNPVYVDVDGNGFEAKGL